MHCRPAVTVTSFNLPGAIYGFDHSVFTGAQGVTIVCVADFEWQRDAQPLLQINRRCQSDRLAAVVGIELGDRIWVGELLERCPCKSILRVDVTADKKRVGFFDVIRWALLRT